MATLKQGIQKLWNRLALPVKIIFWISVLAAIFLIGRSCRNVDPKIAILEGEKIVLKQQLTASEKTHEAQRKEWDKKTAELQGHIDSAYTKIAQLDQTAAASSKERTSLEAELKLVEGDLGKSNKILRDLYDRAKVELDLSTKARAEDAKIIFNLKEQIVVERAAKVTFQKDWLDEKQLRETVEKQSKLKDVKIFQLKAKGTILTVAEVATVVIAGYFAFKK